MGGCGGRVWWEGMVRGGKDYSHLATKSYVVTDQYMCGDRSAHVC